MLDYDPNRHLRTNHIPTSATKKRIQIQNPKNFRVGAVSPLVPSPKKPRALTHVQ